MFYFPTVNFLIDLRVFGQQLVVILLTLHFFLILLVSLNVQFAIYKIQDNITNASTYLSIICAVVWVKN